MKIKLFWKLAILLFFVSFPYLAEATTILRLPGGFTISNMVKHSYLVFTGEVIDLEFVFRANIPPQFTTDVTVKVEEMIKGKPNAGKNLVKFMLPEGEGAYEDDAGEIDITSVKLSGKLITTLGKIKSRLGISK